MAAVGVRQLVGFEIDMVDEDEPAGELSRWLPYLPIPVTGVPTPEVLLYPVEDHVADKLAAMGTLHTRNGAVIASTRYRDLADLALIATSLPVEAEPLLAALTAPARHWARDTFAGIGLRAPDPQWPARYADLARSEPSVAEHWPTIDEALAAAKPLVDPALAGTARGRWNPTTATWV